MGHYTGIEKRTTKELKTTNRYKNARSGRRLCGLSCLTTVLPSLFPLASYLHHEAFWFRINWRPVDQDLPGVVRRTSPISGCCCCRNQIRMRICIRGASPPFQVPPTLSYVRPTKTTTQRWKQSIKLIHTRLEFPILYLMCRFPEPQQVWAHADPMCKQTRHRRLNAYVPAPNT